MDRIRRLVEIISRFLAHISGILSVILLIGLSGSILASIFFRYVVGRALSWPEEISMILFTWLVLITGSLGVRDGFHVRLTLLKNRLPPAAGRLLDRLIILALCGFGAVLTYSGVDLVQRTAKHLTPTLRLPLDWLNYSAPTCGVLICIHALAVLLQKKDPRKP